MIIPSGEIVAGKSIKKNGDAGNLTLPLQLQHVIDRFQIRKMPAIEVQIESINLAKAVS